MITIANEDPRSPDALRLLSAFVEDVKNRYDFPPADVGVFDPALVSVPRSVFLIARRNGNSEWRSNGHSWLAKREATASPQ